jgi:phage terminase small subunit
MPRGRKPGVQPSEAVFLRSGALPAPDDLPEPARSLWREIMASTPEAQWRPGDVPLLGTYCRTATLAAEAARRLEADGQLVDGRPSPWARLLAEHGKTLAALAGKLRLAPSSRIRPDAAGLRQEPAGRRPWETDGDDDLLARPEQWRS